MTIKPLALLCSAVLLAPLAAADKPAWDVSADHGKTKSVRFSTDEGTWLDLDVSPDGKRIVFSMMGDIYLLPISGGTARRHPASNVPKITASASLANSSGCWACTVTPFIDVTDRKSVV